MVNVLWFQVGWWSLLLTATNNLEWLGILISSVLLVVHFRWLSASPKQDLVTLIPCASLGITGDFILIRLGVFQLPDLEAIFPLWLVGMWFLFPLTLPYSMKALINKSFSLPFLALAAGFSYYAGTYFQVLITPEPVTENLLWASSAWFVYLTSFKQILKKRASKA